jgi:hypothetical protein
MTNIPSCVISTEVSEFTTKKRSGEISITPGESMQNVPYTTSEGSDIRESKEIPRLRSE